MKVQIINSSWSNNFGLSFLYRCGKRLGGDQGGPTNIWLGTRFSFPAG